MTAIRIAEEFHLDLVLIHATEGYKIADILAEKGIPCVPGPVLFSRMKLELRGLTPRNAGLLSRAGVKVAIQTDEGSATRYLTLNAALAVNEGMDETEALRAITLTPAEILRIDDRVGSLEPGKDADLAVLTAHPVRHRALPDRTRADRRSHGLRRGLRGLARHGAQDLLVVALGAALVPRGRARRAGLG